MAIIGTFGSYTAARLGIYASQASLNVTGNNIANVNTNGYTRQRMDLRSIYGGAVDRYVSKYSVNIGYGVLTEGVSQLRDPLSTSATARNSPIRARTSLSSKAWMSWPLPWTRSATARASSA